MLFCVCDGDGGEDGIEVQCPYLEFSGTVDANEEIVSVVVFARSSSSPAFMSSWVGFGQ